MTIESMIESLQAHVRRVRHSIGEGDIFALDRALTVAARNPSAGWTAAEEAHTRARELSRARENCVTICAEAISWGREEHHAARCVRELDLTIDLLAAARYVAMAASGYAPAHLWAARAIDALEVAA